MKKFNSSSKLFKENSLISKTDHLHNKVLIKPQNFEEYFDKER
jgi:hypothetical protein